MREEVDWKPLSPPPVTILPPRLTTGGCRLGRRQDEGDLKLEFPEHPSSAKIIYQLLLFVDAKPAELTTYCNL